MTGDCHHQRRLPPHFLTRGFAPCPFPLGPRQKGSTKIWSGILWPGMAVGMGKIFRAGAGFCFTFWGKSFKGNPPVGWDSQCKAVGQPIFFTPTAHSRAPRFYNRPARPAAAVLSLRQRCTNARNGKEKHGKASVKPKQQKRRSVCSSVWAVCLLEGWFCFSSFFSSSLPCTACQWFRIRHYDIAFWGQF